MFIVLNDFDVTFVLETLQELLEMVERDFQSYCDIEYCDYNQDTLYEFIRQRYDIYEVKRELTSNDFCISSKVVKKLVEEKFITLKTD